jgi:predicted HAD superfamily phosphohydrolase
MDRRQLLGGTVGLCALPFTKLIPQTKAKDGYSKLIEDLPISHDLKRTPINEIKNSRLEEDAFLGELMKKAVNNDEQALESLSDFSEHLLSDYFVSNGYTVSYITSWYTIIASPLIKTDTTSVSIDCVARHFENKRTDIFRRMNDAAHIMLKDWLDEYHPGNMRIGKVRCKARFVPKDIHKDFPYHMVNRVEISFSIGVIDGSSKDQNTRT